MPVSIKLLPGVNNVSIVGYDNRGNSGRTWEVTMQRQAPTSASVSMVHNFSSVMLQSHAATATIGLSADSLPEFSAVYVMNSVNFSFPLAVSTTSNGTYSTFRTGWTPDQLDTGACACLFACLFPRPRLWLFTLLFVVCCPPPTRSVQSFLDVPPRMLFSKQNIACDNHRRAGYYPTQCVCLFS